MPASKQYYNLYATTAVVPQGKLNTNLRNEAVFYFMIDDLIVTLDHISA